MAKLPERLMVRHRTYYCRIWVPKEIVPTFGRQLVVASLRTQDLRLAKSRLARKIVELEDQFARLRGRPTAAILGSGPPLRAEFPAIARAHASSAVDAELARRVSLYQSAHADPAAFWSGALVDLPTPSDFGHGTDDAYTYFDHLTAEGDLDAILAYIHRFHLRRRIQNLKKMRAAGNLAHFLDLAEVHTPGTGPDAYALAATLLAEEIQALQRLADGDAPYERLVPMGAAMTATPPPTRDDAVQAAVLISLEELFARWEQEVQPSASTLSSWRGIARDLKGFLAGKADDITSISTDDIVAWKDALVRAEKSAATISKGYLACARALFRFAVANKLIDNDPAEGVRLARKLTKAGTKKLPYGNDEVARLLNLARQEREPSKRWLPWLAAATGSRIGEMAQLQGDSFCTEAGLHVVRIAPAPDAGSIKNAESERTVPLHPALIEDGLLEFVAQSGSGPLFYGRSSGDPKRKHASKSVSNRLAKWIREQGFVDPRKAPNHALRHWFKTEASRLGVPDSVADAIQGHADRSVSSVYRHVGLDVMAAAIARIQLPPETAV